MKNTELTGGAVRSGYLRFTEVLVDEFDAYGRYDVAVGGNVQFLELLSDVFDVKPLAELLA